MNGSDDGAFRRSPSYRPIGIGANLLMRCWYCNEPRSRAGGKFPPPHKLFKCAVCLLNDAKKSRAQIEEPKSLEGQ